MRATRKFTQRFETEINRRVEAAYADLNSMSACAGVTGSMEGATEASKNHNGYVFEKNGRYYYAPPRDFVSFATRGKDYSDEIKKIIKERVRAAKVTHSHWVTDKYSSGTSYKRVEGGTTTPFYAGPYKKNSPHIIMEKIAKQMADNQFDAIKSWKVTPPNSKVWRKMKGMDLPPLEGLKGEIVDNIEGWVE